MNFLRCDCAVIGAGAAGLCAGARAAKGGLTTFVIDREGGKVHLGCIDDRILRNARSRGLLLTLVAAGDGGDHQCSSRCKQKNLFHG